MHDPKKRKPCDRCGLGTWLRVGAIAVHHPQPGVRGPGHLRGSGGGSLWSTYGLPVVMSGNPSVLVVSGFEQFEPNHL